MKLTNLSIRDLINEEEKLTFLVGAGCSVDAPSCLPAGKEMMNAIIDYTCEASEIEKIKSLERLRFEQLVEILSKDLDPKLKVIDFYELCDKPNLQHFFLAEIMKRGQFVLTTNFDFLIEHALQQSGVPKEEIKVVITKNDFETYNNPQELYSDGIKALYKIHGSTKNQVTQEDTRESLIATIQAFGSNKEGENVFQLENFKQSAFINLTSGRSLVVMGYSGGDDFDIIPTLKILKNTQEIIWINHVLNDEGKELIYEITSNGNKADTISRKVDQILVEIKHMNYTKRVFRVDVNTTRLIREMITNQVEISFSAFNIDAYDWISNNIDIPNKIIKLYIPYQIYFNFDMYSDSLRILKEILRIAIDEKIDEWKSFALYGIGLIYNIQGNYPEALKQYEETLQIYKQLGSLKNIAATLNNIGEVYCRQGQYSEALKQYEEALHISEQLENLGRKAEHLSYIGGIYEAQGNYPKALRLFKKALQIHEELGNLTGKAARLDNIGQIYGKQGNYSEVLKMFNEALQIDDQLGNLSGKASDLNNIGMIYNEQGNYPKALKLYEEALQIDEKLGDLRGKATRFTNIGSIYYARGNYPKALKLFEMALNISEKLGDLASKSTILNHVGRICEIDKSYPEALIRYEEALKIAEQLGDLSGISTCLNLIGNVYYKQGNYPQALKLYEEALQIKEKLGDLSGIGKSLTNIGMIFHNQGNYPEALKRYEEALKIAKKLEDLNGKSACLSNIGVIHRAQGDFPEALKCYEEALKLAEQIGDLSGKASCLHNIGIIYEAQGNYQNALKYLEDGLQIFEQLGDSDEKVNFLNNIASIHFRQEDYQKALNYLEEALEILVEKGLGNSPTAQNIKNGIHYIKSERR